MKIVTIDQGCLKLYFDVEYAIECLYDECDIKRNIIEKAWSYHNDVIYSDNFIVTSVDNDDYDDEKYEFVPSNPSCINYILLLVSDGNDKFYICSSNGGKDITIIIQGRNFNAADFISLDKMAGHRFGRERYSKKDIRKIMYAISHVNNQFISDCNVWGTQLRPNSRIDYNCLEIKNKTKFNFLILPML